MPYLITEIPPHPTRDLSSEPSPPFTQLLELQNTCFETPFMSFWLAVRGPSLPNFTARSWTNYQKNLNSRYIQVTDSETGELVGGGEWHFNETDPYPPGEPEKVVAAYWEEGPQRSISTQMLNQFIPTRPQRMRKPHALLARCFTHPAHRRKAISRVMIEWGLGIADKLGLETYTEAAPMATPLYLAAGFVRVGEVVLTAELEDEGEPTREWEVVREKWIGGGFVVPILWRPVRGVLDGVKVDEKAV